MAKAKCSRTDFNKAPDDQLDSKGAAVRDGLTTHMGTFPAPPVSAATVGTQVSDFIVKRNAYTRGGLDQKPAFVASKNLLIESLEANADYVDDIADGDEELIVNAGYVPTKTEATPKPVPSKPTGVVVKRGEAVGEVLIECEAQAVGEFYGVIVSEGGPLAGFSFSHGLIRLDRGPANRFAMEVNKSRKKHFDELTPGTTYYFYMYIGNAAGISALSDVVSIMAA
jgi:hypothetical protein